ncbi:hypothetical protein ACPA54_09115 [Uniformispora flossi]|uniref:hypothetical protein n=1 Tax=Uniformispora flossi TaxID=3390723 RepID=UPI003C2E0718
MGTELPFTTVGVIRPNAVRPYVPELGPLPAARTCSVAPDLNGFHGKIRIVAWGFDPVHAAVALRLAGEYARAFGYEVVDELASYGPDMVAAPLVKVALARFERRDVSYDRAWWAVPHGAISRDEFERARWTVRQQWAAEAAGEGDMRAPNFDSLTPTADACPPTSGGEPRAVADSAHPDV